MHYNNDQLIDVRHPRLFLPIWLLTGPAADTSRFGRAAV